jgi:hypothetical protein
MKPLLPILLAAALAVVAACDASRETFDNPLGTTSTPGKAERTFECLHRSPDGTCNANKCTQGPGGATYDCGSFASACVNAGFHWTGSKEGGTCRRPL